MGQKGETKAAAKQASAQQGLEISHPELS